MKVKITLADDEEVSDFRLLLKLSYAPTYVKDDDIPLSKDMLIRVASMANAFEFHDAVKECMGALGGKLTFEEAITCMDELPLNLQDIDGTNVLIQNAMEVLGRGLADPSSLGLTAKKAKDEMLKKGADAVARYLGPVADLFTQGPVSRYRRTFGKGPLLNAFVKDLPIQALERILQSDDLQVQCENEVYYLIIAWFYAAYEGKESQQKEVFNRLYRHVRHRHLTPGYLNAIVSCCPFMRKSGKLSEVFAQATLPSSIPTWIFDSVNDIGNIPVGPVDRSKDKAREWRIKVNVNLTDLLELQKGDDKYIPCGVVLGHAFYLIIEHEEEENGKTSFGVYWDVSRPPLPSNDDDGLPDERCVGLRIDYKVGSSGVESRADYFFGAHAYGRFDVYDKPWEKVVYEGSPYFPNGKTYVEATEKDLLLCEPEQDDEDEEEDEEEEDDDNEEKDEPN